MQIFLSLTALLAGAIIGVAFGLIQNRALLRNQKLQQSGSLNNGWAVMPGSMKRVGWLLVALVLVQLVCPLLFVNGTQWWVSGGVVAGYAAMLALRLKNH
jgi:hypothetical protein